MGAGRFLSVIAWALGCVPAGAQHRVGLFTRDLQSSSFYIAEIAVDGLPKVRLTPHLVLPACVMLGALQWVCSSGVWWWCQACSMW